MAAAVADLTDQYDPLFKAAGEEWDVDPLLLKALIKHESGGKVDAKGTSGEIGLAQLMPATAAHLGVTNRYDPAQSIYGAAKYLHEAEGVVGDNPTKALLYYNGGPGMRGNPAYPSYVGGEYAKFQKAGVQFAQADTGTKTDATPAPAPTDGGDDDPAKLSDTAWLDRMSKTYPGLAGPNADTKDQTVAQPSTKDDTPSNDDFLKQIAPHAAGAKGKSDLPSDDEFLKELNANASAPLPNAQTAPGPTQRPGPQPQLPTTSEYGDLGNAWWNTQAQPPPGQEGSPTLNAAGAAIGRVGTAAAQGFQEHPFLTPQAAAAADAANNQSIAGRYLVAPGLALANLPFRALNALAAGVGQGAYEAGAAVSPALGRDLYMLNQVLPEAARGGQLLKVSPEADVQAAAKAATPGTSGATFTGVNPISPDAAARAAPRPVGATEPSDIPVPPPDAAAAKVAGQAAPAGAAGAEAPPNSAGAMGTPASSAAMTPAETRAYQATAEGRKLIEQQQPGVPDRNAYVPGVTANLAEQEQTAQIARELKALKVSSANATQDDLEAAAANNQARQSYFERIAGGKVELKNAEDARAAQAESDLAATWANKTEADAQPVIDQADAILKSPDGRRPAVRRLVNSVTNELKDEDGNLISDPEQLYGVRKHIDDLLSPEGQRETPLSKRGVAALQSLKNALDPQIEEAAPGFGQYLQNFRNASQRIDEMKVLQDHEAGLYDAQNRMTYARVQKMMRNIVDSRNAPGVNPYKSISDDTMGQLWNLRDDLRRSSSALELARANGSDTAQNAMDIAKQYAKYGGTLAVHAVANHIAPVAGSFVVRGVQQAYGVAKAARAARQMERRAQEILHPPNPLRDPNAP